MIIFEMMLMNHTVYHTATDNDHAHDNGIDDKTMMIHDI